MSLPVSMASKLWLVEVYSRWGWLWWRTSWVKNAFSFHISFWCFRAYHFSLILKEFQTPEKKKRSSRRWFLLRPLQALTSELPWWCHTLTSNQQRGSAACYLSTISRPLYQPPTSRWGGWGAPQLPLKTQHTHLTTRSTPFHICLPLSPAPLLLSLLYWSVRSPTQTTDSWTECHVTSRCNYSAPSIHLPPISRSDRRQLLSRLPSQPPNLSPGNLGSVGCRHVISPSRRGPYQAEGSPNRWGGWRTKRQRQISICCTNKPSPPHQRKPQESALCSWKSCKNLLFHVVVLVLLSLEATLKIWQMRNFMAFETSSSGTAPTVCGFS